LDDVGLGRTFHDALVTAMSLDDEIISNEMFEEPLDTDTVSTVRERAKAVHDRASHNFSDQSHFRISRGVWESDFQSESIALMGAQSIEDKM